MVRTKVGNCNAHKQVPISRYRAAFMEVGITLKDLLSGFGASHNVEKICSVNGVFCFEEKTFQQGDVTSKYPMLRGG